MLESLVDWLLSTRLSQVLQEVEWLVPTLQTLHILFIAVVLASVGMIILRVLGLLGRGWNVPAMGERFLPWVWVALAVLVVTGALLITAEPRRSLLNWVFQLKMLMLATMIVVTALFQRSIRRDRAAWESPAVPRLAARAIGAVSLLTWIATIVAGRWIAYVTVP